MNAARVCRAAALAAVQSIAPARDCIQRLTFFTRGGIAASERHWSATAAASDSSGDHHHDHDDGQPATAVIAIGSNEGNRVDLFRRALRALDEAGIAGTRPSRSNQSHILISRRNLFHHPRSRVHSS
jgi:hypothetical protein|tara:strand:+ start:96 stop:476 length:381 start_codon:yes stop_codon:yes gene_type:complete